MMRISAGTAACLGLSTNRMDAYPTTAYLLCGKQCRMNCAFCPQGGTQNSVLKRLGRVSWPEYAWPAVKKALERASQHGVRRICLQSVRHDDGIATLLRTVERVKALSALPLSLSAWIKDEKEAEALIQAGVDRLSIALDVANADLYEKLKGGSFAGRLALLLNCAQKIPGKMSTHLICGLGESEEETLVLVERLLREKITVALFALTPLKGTALEQAKPPPVEVYRRIQAAHYLLLNRQASLEAFNFSGGQLCSFGLPNERLKAILEDGEAFRTTGCPECNRPYYNERPGGLIYNYHRPLSVQESAAALDELFRGISVPCG